MYLDTLGAGWAHPFGLSQALFLLGFGVVAEGKDKPPAPTKHPQIWEDRDTAGPWPNPAGGNGVILTQQSTVKADLACARLLLRQGYDVYAPLWRWLSPEAEQEGVKPEALHEGLA